MRTILVGDGAAPGAARRAVREALRRAAPQLAIGRGDVVVRFVDPETMRELNREWRGKDRPTDVLSFPSGTDGPDGRRHIGDIALCWEVARAQAARRRQPPEREAALLALHGLLHLCGYDHETDDGTMDALERKLRRAILPARAPA